jgi:hypothetical protein
MPRPPRPWFRFWSEAIENRKLQSLNGDQFKLYVNLMCIANRNEPRGTLPEPQDVAFALRMDTNALTTDLAELKRLKFLDGNPRAYRVHGWEEWQRESDANKTPGRRGRNAERTPKERAKPATGVPLERIDKDTEEDRDKEKDTDEDEDKEPERETGPWSPQQFEEHLRNKSPIIKHAEDVWARPITPWESQRLLADVDDYGDECVRHSLEESGSANIRNIRYVEGICRRHQERGDCYAGKPGGAGNAASSEPVPTFDPSHYGLATPVFVMEPKPRTRELDPPLEHPEIHEGGLDVRGRGEAVEKRDSGGSLEARSHASTG